MPARTHTLNRSLTSVHLSALRWGANLPLFQLIAIRRGMCAFPRAGEPANLMHLTLTAVQFSNYTHSTLAVARRALPAM